MVILRHGGYRGDADTESNRIDRVFAGFAFRLENGSFSGLKVRNGGEVSAKWTEGLLTEARLKAIVPGIFRIKLPANSANLSLKKNQKPVSLPVIDGMLTVDLQQGDELILIM